MIRLGIFHSLWEYWTDTEKCKKSLRLRNVQRYNCSASEDRGDTHSHSQRKAAFITSGKNLGSEKCISNLDQKG